MGGVNMVSQMHKELEDSIKAVIYEEEFLDITIEGLPAQYGPIFLFRLATIIETYTQFLNAKSSSIPAI